MVIKLPEVESNDQLPEVMKKRAETTKPIEDIGVVVLDNRRITITQGLLEALLENNCAVITCDSHSLPVGLMLPLYGNSTQNERFRYQLEASLPLRKQLWQQTVRAKILNQAFCLQKNTPKSNASLHVLANNVKSGDPENCEAQAAVYYWRNIFTKLPSFQRDPESDVPNNLLNYGYAILRATIARALVGSGLLPVYGIHHHNRYNAFCLADDIMEPYRPFVDDLVIKTMDKMTIPEDLTIKQKREMLTIPVLDVILDGQRRPLMIAAGLTAASLAKCFNGEIRKISYPEFP